MTLSEFLRVVTPETDVDIWGKDIDTGRPVSIAEYGSVSEDEVDPDILESTVITVEASAGGLIDVTVDIEVNTREEDYLDEDKEIY